MVIRGTREGTRTSTRIGIRIGTRRGFNTRIIISKFGATTRV